jgi:RNA polymerase sigma factor (sigma-70 family)
MQVLTKKERDQLIRDHVYWAKTLATNWSRRVSLHSYEDFLSVAFEALTLAAVRFDPNNDKKASFKTYATHYINGKILHFLRDFRVIRRDRYGQIDYQIYSLNSKYYIDDWGKKIEIQDRISDTKNLDWVDDKIGLELMFQQIKPLLDDDQIFLFQKYYVEGLEIKKVAQLAGCSHQAGANRLRRLAETIRGFYHRGLLPGVFDRGDNAAV